MKRNGAVLILLALSLAVFSMIGCDSGKRKQLENQVSQLNQLIVGKDARIKTLTDQATLKQNELNGVRQELVSSKNELDSVRKELITVKSELDRVSKEINALKVAPAAPVAPAVPKK